jgi:hypothetical protein
MTQADEILTIFRQIASEGRRIRLLNLYKGIPISYAARIASIGDASVTVQTEKIQLVCMYREKETFIQHVKFPHLVRAGVVMVDTDKVHGLLSHFSYQPERIGELTRVRVQPARTISSVLVSEGTQKLVSGELVDISLDGVAVKVDQRELSNACQPGETVQIQIHLPKSIPFQEGPDQIPLDLSGSIANIKTGLPDGKCRIGVQLHPESPARLDLAHFITQRQTELLREIRSIYELVSLVTKEQE